MKELEEEIQKLTLSLTYLDNVSKIISDNQYETYFKSHIVPIKIELKRQLSLLYARQATD